MICVGDFCRLQNMPVVQGKKHAEVAVPEPPVTTSLWSKKWKLGGDSTKTQDSAVDGNEKPDGRREGIIDRGLPSRARRGMPGSPMHCPVQRMTEAQEVAEAHQRSAGAGHPVHPPGTR